MPTLLFLVASLILHFFNFRKMCLNAWSVEYTFANNQLSLSLSTPAPWSKEVSLINHLKSMEDPKMRKQDIKPFAWGMAVGAVALLIVIFSAGWVVTSGSAEAQAKQVASQAVIDRLAPISMAQFQADPNREAGVSEMKALQSWKRSEYVMGKGWAKMPGEKESDSSVAAECAKRIAEINKM
jgi:hypothetical protein